MIKEPIRLPGWQSGSYCGHTSSWLPKRYFSPFGVSNQTITPQTNFIFKPSITGWCSWHWFGFNINEEIILNQARLIARNRDIYPLDYILIDDGWCRLGDWLEPNRRKFPHGMKWLATEIKKLGLKPGIWIAPFFSEFASMLFRNRPELFIRGAKGRIIEGTKVGFFDFLNPLKRGILDLCNNNVQIYLKEVIDNIVEWGFELIKLDFLYANHFNPKFKNSEEPDRLLREFLLSIRNSYPQMYTLACGCPLKPALSAVDALRISDDINVPQLKYLWPFNSLIFSLRLKQLESNLDYRVTLSKFVNLDPDAFLCHKGHGLQPSQIVRLQNLVKQAGGLKFLGDDLTKLNKKEIEKFIKPLFN